MDRGQQAVRRGGVSFTYAGDGRRLKRVSAGSTTLSPLGDDYEIKDGLATKYLRVGAPLAKRVGGVTYWLHTDRLGSVQAVTDALGQDKLRRTYRPSRNPLGLRLRTGWRRATALGCGSSCKVCPHEQAEGIVPG